MSATTIRKACRVFLWSARFFIRFRTNIYFYWNFRWSPQYQILGKSLSWGPRWCMRRAGQRYWKRDGRKDMNQSDAFRFIATHAW